MQAEVLILTTNLAIKFVVSFKFKAKHEENVGSLPSRRSSFTGRSSTVKPKGTKQISHLWQPHWTHAEGSQRCRTHLNCTCTEILDSFTGNKNSWQEWQKLPSKELIRHENSRWSYFDKVWKLNSNIPTSVKIQVGLSLNRECFEDGVGGVPLVRARKMVTLV
jgi:hypothetical protein